MSKPKLQWVQNKWEEDRYSAKTKLLSYSGEIEYFNREVVCLEFMIDSVVLSPQNAVWGGRWGSNPLNLPYESWIFSSKPRHLVLICTESET